MENSTLVLVPCFSGAPWNLSQMTELKKWPMKTMKLPDDVRGRLFPGKSANHRRGYTYEFNAQLIAENTKYSLYQDNYCFRNSERTTTINYS